MSRETSAIRRWMTTKPDGGQLIIKAESSPWPGCAERVCIEVASVMNVHLSTTIKDEAGAAALEKMKVDYIERAVYKHLRVHPQVMQSITDLNRLMTRIDCTSSHYEILRKIITDLTKAVKTPHPRMDQWRVLT